MASQKLIFKKLTEDAIFPKKATPDAAGFDIFNHRPCDYPPGFSSHGTGISIRPPRGYVFKIEERSSAAAIGLTIGGGLVDEDFDLNSEIILIVYNKFTLTIHGEIGKSICQGVIYKKYEPAILEIGFKDTRQVNVEMDSDHTGIGSTGNAIQVPEQQGHQFTRVRPHPKPLKKNEKCSHCAKSLK